MNLSNRPYKTEEEREAIIRQVTNNGISGTRFYMDSEPLSVFPDTFNSFVIWGLPCHDPTSQAAFGHLKEMGMEMSIVGINDPTRPVLTAFKAISTYDSFRYIFLDHITATY